MRILIIAPSLLPDKFGPATSAQFALAHTLSCSCPALPFTSQIGINEGLALRSAGKRAVSFAVSRLSAWVHPVLLSGCYTGLWQAVL